MRDTVRVARRSSGRIVPLCPFDDGDEPVAAVGDGFDVARAVLAVSEYFPQARDGLVDAVVGDGRVGPRSLGERVLGDHVAEA